MGVTSLKKVKVKSRHRDYIDKQDDKLRLEINDLNGTVRLMQNDVLFICTFIKRTRNFVYSLSFSVLMLIIMIYCLMG